jgi:hypothetical protein
MEAEKVCYLPENFGWGGGGGANLKNKVLSKAINATSAVTPLPLEPVPKNPQDTERFQKLGWFWESLYGTNVFLYGYLIPHPAKFGKGDSASLPSSANRRILLLREARQTAGGSRNKKTRLSVNIRNAQPAGKPGQRMESGLSKKEPALGTDARKPGAPGTYLLSLAGGGPERGG